VVNGKNEKQNENEKNGKLAKSKTQKGVSGKNEIEK
jgi:hypothetical protein